MDSQAPIGMFDSGLGGLSVLQEIRAILPGEDVIYYADSGNCPYGDRSASFIRDRSFRIADYLVEQEAKSLIVACNTVTSVALADLRARYSVPIIGMVPALKPAVAKTLTNRIAVLATVQTVAGKALAHLVRDFAHGVQVYTVAGHGLVEYVERGCICGPDVERTLLDLLAPVIMSDVDVIVLGCTHYPFLKPAIREVVGEEIAIIDSGGAIARRVRFILEQQSTLRANTESGTVELLTSDDPDRSACVASGLLGSDIRAVHLSL